MKRNAVKMVLIFATIVFLPNNIFTQSGTAAGTVKPLSAQARDFIQKDSKIEADIWKPCVALTFDDGPHKYLTPRLLDILKNNDVKATFFVVGNRMKVYPDIVKRIYNEGHEVGDHTWGHAWLTQIGIGKATWQIKSAKDTIFQTTGVKPKLFRPPYGATNKYIADIVAKMGMRQIIWNVDPCDWRDYTPERTANYILKNTHDGDIILMHDIHANTIKAVPGIISMFRKKGYVFVAVSSILEIRNQRWLAKKAKQDNQILQAKR
ncbi:MAG TPA: polysaccharide deacetylase family protein [Patescibacteria group bacterium]|nr:polysaccharide deacetylase family protein [Patescibacteria group bacterium]